MKTNAPLPKNEDERLKTLSEYNILDTLPEDAFDRLTKLASIICGVPIALISLIDKNRQWFKSSIGLDVSETPRDLSFCQHAIVGDSLMEVSDATKDERFFNNPLVTDTPNIKFYAGYPLIDKNGFALGTLCVIDRKAKVLNPEQREALTLLANEAVSQIVTRKKNIEKDKLEKLFDLSLDMICIASSDGYFKKINPAFTSTLGWSTEELKENPFVNFIHPDDVQSTIDEVKKLSKGIKTVDFENRFRTKSGEYLSIAWVANPDEHTGEIFSIGRNISERKNWESKLLSSEAKYRGFFENSRSLVCTHDLKGNILSINRASALSIGYSVEEACTKNFFDIVPPHAKEYVQIFLEELEQDGLSKGLMKIKHKDGSIKTWMYDSIVFTQSDGSKLVLGTAVDLTERILLEKELKESNNRFFKIFDKNPVIMAISNMATKQLEYVNESFLEIFGYTRQEVIGKTSTELNMISEADREQTIAVLNKQGYVRSMEGVMSKKNGEKFWVLNSIEIIDIGGAPFLVSSMNNIEERKKMEEEIINAREKAEQAVLAKNSFLANMSHEIRTPMNAIIGFTDLLEQSELDEDQKECVDSVKLAGINLLAIINDILDFSKIESGNVTLESTQFNLKETLKNVYNLLNIKAKEKNLEYDFFLDGSLPEYVVGDSVRLNQILINLIGNAIKFTEEGGVTISVKKTEEDELNYSIRFTVKDTGIGIPKEMEHTIFDRFAQVNAETTRKFGGTGLGLSIAKNLVELQGGEIQLKSELNKGSEFSFEIRYKKADTDAIHFSKTSFVPDAKLKDIKVLLCEDNALNQNLAKKVFIKFGIDFVIAANGKIGLEKLKESNFDLILMDLQMPEMDGYQTTIIIREELKLKIPIIAMTAHSLVGEKEKCFEIGMNDYVGKPFTQEELYSKITTNYLKYKS
ncbi:MAG: PAS domain S-box protein [Bacteroidota bacterium]